MPLSVPWSLTRVQPILVLPSAVSPSLARCAMQTRTVVPAVFRPRMTLTRFVLRTMIAAGLFFASPVYAQVKDMQHVIYGEGDVLDNLFSNSGYY